MGRSEGVESISVLNVTCLGCCLFSVVRASNLLVAASFCRHVESLKTQKWIG